MTANFKAPPLRDRKYLDTLRSRPCIITGIHPSDFEAVDPGHIGTAGKGIKSPDNEALPILHSIHQEMHNRGEISVLREKAPDWLLRAMARAYGRELYQEYLEQEDR